jgi:hypothetical protein
MATIHQATITPTKLELLSAWLPGRHWYPGDSVKDLQRVAACRLDDPDGEVGVEILLVQDEHGPLVQVPLTYRAAELEGAELHLVGTTEHSVLGTRWVYDAVADPVYVQALATTISTGDHEAEEIVETENGPQRRDPLMRVRGTGWAHDTEPAGPLVRVEEGDPAVSVAFHVRLETRRLLSDEPAAGPLHLLGTWGPEPTPMVLAELC